MAVNPVLKTSFYVDRLRLEAARSLPAQCFDDFQRLTRTLIHGPAFQWLLVDARHELFRQQVMAALDKVLATAGLNVSCVQFDQSIADVEALETLLVKNAAQADVVHVIGPPGWFDAPRWDAFNVRRERIATHARARLVFWLDADAIALASQGAPDLWAWRSGVYAFAPQHESEWVDSAALGISTNESGIPGLDNRNKTDRYRRVGEIQSWLEAHPGAPDEMQAAPMYELGTLLFDLGDYAAALAHWQQVVLPFFQRIGAEHEAAVTKGKIADILEARGQLDEALLIRREELLSVYDRLGDVRSRAVIQGKIADILYTRGQLDEALHIRCEEELPVFERLGDVRERTITQGKIADIHQARGQLDEALRILREEVLPAFERLGDIRSCAITQGKIADILQERGQLDEALRIRREEELPVFERLGDVRARAITQSQIVNILKALGQQEEALRILREEMLPVFERLGDVRSRALTQGNIAAILQKRGQLDEALRIHREEELPVFDHLGDVRERAITQSQVAEILQARGQLDEALRILREETLPVFERLGDIRSRAMCQLQIARALRKKDPHQVAEALRLLQEALQALKQLGLPEADSVEQELCTLLGIGRPSKSFI